jgi:hypothetical protein
LDNRTRSAATKALAALGSGAAFLAGGNLAIQAIDQTKLVQILFVVSHFGLTLLQILCR